MRLTLLVNKFVGRQMQNQAIGIIRDIANGNVPEAKKLYTDPNGPEGPGEVQSRTEGKWGRSGTVTIPTDVPGDP